MVLGTGRFVFLYLDLSLSRVLAEGPEDGSHLGTGAASLRIAELAEGVLVNPWGVGSS